MYYWMSCGIHVLLVLSFAALGAVILRYSRLKPKISKVTSADDTRETRGISAEEHADAVDPNTLYK